MALYEPAGSAFAESRQSRILLVGGLRILVPRPDAFVPALPLVCRSEAPPQGLVVELFIVKPAHKSAEPLGRRRQGQGQFTFTAGPDAPGPTKVLMRTAGTQVFLLVRYSL